MPKGSPLGLKCPKCKRGKWGEPRREKGCTSTGSVFLGSACPMICVLSKLTAWSTLPREGLTIRLKCTLIARTPLLRDPSVGWVREGSEFLDGKRRSSNGTQAQSVDVSRTTCAHSRGTSPRHGDR